MSIRLYMDVHVRRAVTDGLRLRGVDVLTAREDGTLEYSDSELLDRSTELERVLFTQDDDLLREAKKRQESDTHFAGQFEQRPLNTLRLQGPDNANGAGLFLIRLPKECVKYRRDCSASDRRNGKTGFESSEYVRDTCGATMIPAVVQ